MVKCQSCVRFSFNACSLSPQERNFHYVVEVEVYLARELNFNPMEDDEEDTLYVTSRSSSVFRLYPSRACRAFDGIVPPHFYGEMAKTDFGCQVLRDKGHFADFAHFIRQHGLESDDFEILLKLKSILWAVVSASVRIVLRCVANTNRNAGQHRCD